MNAMEQVCPLEGPVRASRQPCERLTDCYISVGKIGKLDLSLGCYSWWEVLPIVAVELRKTGEAEQVREHLKTGCQTVRQLLRERFGIVTGAREGWHRVDWTPDKADQHEFLKLLTSGRQDQSFDRSVT